MPSPGEPSRTFQRLLLFCCNSSLFSSVFQLLSLVSWGPFGGGSAVQPFTRLTLKDSEPLPLLSQPLYGGLMIYCSDFSLFSSYLEGGQFNKHARFLPPGLQIVLSRREMCRGATVCSTAVTQFRDFFTRSASEGAEKSSEKPENLPGGSFSAPDPQTCSSHAGNSRRQNNVNSRRSREVTCPVCDLSAPYCTLLPRFRDVVFLVFFFANIRGRNQRKHSHLLSCSREHLQNNLFEVQPGCFSAQNDKNVRPER